MEITEIDTGNWGYYGYDKKKIGRVGRTMMEIREFKKIIEWFGDKRLKY